MIAVEAAVPARPTSIPELYVTINLEGGILEDIHFHPTQHAGEVYLLRCIDLGAFDPDQDGEMKLLKTKPDGDTQQLLAIWDNQDCELLREKLSATLSDPTLGAQL